MKWVISTTIVIMILMLLGIQCWGGTLYGLSEEVQLIKIDPVTAKSTTIGKPLPNELQAQNLASFDKKNGIYYLVGDNSKTNKVQLIGVSIKSGVVLSTMDLPFLESGFVGVGQYVALDPKTGQVIVIGEIAAGVHQMLRVDPKAKTSTNLGTFNGSDVLGAFSAYDSTNEILFIESISGSDMIIIGFDTTTGKLVKTLQNPMIIESLDWDSKTGLLFGIGLRIISSQKFVRTLCSLDGKTGTFKEISVLADFQIISSSIATLDPVGRSLFAFLSKPANTSEFYLVSVNIDTGAIQNSPLACTNDAICPWSIEYDETA